MQTLQSQASPQPMSQPLSGDSSTLSAQLQSNHILNGATTGTQSVQQQATLNNTLLTQQQLYQRTMAPPHMSMIPSSFYSPQSGTTTLAQNHSTNNTYLQSPQQQYQYLNGMNNNTLSMNVMMPSTPPLDYTLLQHQQQLAAAANINNNNPNVLAGLYGNNPLLFNQNNMLNYNPLNNMQQSNPTLQSHTQPSNNNSNASTPNNSSHNQPVDMQQHLNLLQQLSNNQSTAAQQQSQVNRQLSGHSSSQQQQQQSLMSMSVMNNNAPNQQPMFNTQALFNQYNMAALHRTASNNSQSNSSSQPMNINQITGTPNWQPQSQMYMNENQSRNNTMSPIADSTAALAQAMQARAESLARMHGTNTMNYNNNNTSALASDVEYTEDAGTDPDENRVVTAGGRKMKTGMQSKILKAFYTKQQRPSKDDVQALVNLSGLPYHEISRWFRNERHKDKKSREAKTAALSALNRPPSATTVSTASPQVKPVRKLKNNHTDTSVQNTPVHTALQTRDEIDAQNILIQGISDAAHLATQSSTEYKTMDVSSDSDDDVESHTSNDCVDPDQSSPDNGDKPMQQTEINTVDTLTAHQLSHQQATNAENVRNGNDSPIKPPDTADNLSVAEIDKLHGTTSPADKQFQLNPTAADAWNYLHKLFVQTPKQSSKRKRDQGAIDDDMLNGLVALFKPHRVYLKRVCDQLLPYSVSPVTNLI